MKKTGVGRDCRWRNHSSWSLGTCACSWKRRACWPRNLAYHRRARLETTIGRALEEVDRQIEDLRANGASWSFAVEAEYCVRMRRTVPGVIMLRSDWKD